MQVFFGNIIPTGATLDITSFLDGTLYVGGYGAAPEELPSSADAVKAQPDQIIAMKKLARTYLSIDPDEDLEVLHEGRCYRPLAVPNHPIITKVDWSLLGVSDSILRVPV